VSAGGNVSVGGQLKIHGDTPMSAAPHMFVTGVFPGGLTAGMPPAFYFIPSKDILVTRFTMFVQIDTACSPMGTVSLLNAGNSTVDYYDLNITNDFNDSFPISIPIPAGTQVWATVTTQPNCGLYTGVHDARVSLEYEMR